MLYVKYLLRDYVTLPVELRADLFTSIEYGYKRGLLTSDQVTCIRYWIYGYYTYEIAERMVQTTEQVQTLLLRAFRVIETLTLFTDQSVIVKHKGTVKGEWIAKADYIAATEWDGLPT